jgi:hypothetical protein
VTTTIGAIWFGLEPAASSSAANSHVLSLGNSRTQFGFCSCPGSLLWRNAMSTVEGSREPCFEFSHPRFPPASGRLRAHVVCSKNLGAKAFRGFESTRMLGLLKYLAPASKFMNERLAGFR